MATVCVGAFMGQLDSSIVTLAFPSLHRQLHAPLSSVQWVGQAYLLVLIGLLPAVGRLADMRGRKLLYVYGFVVFSAGSAAAALAPTLGTLIACRVLQGAGAAMLQANSVAIILGAVPRHRRGQALGIQGAAQALGLAIGPAVGGLLIGLGGWRLIFWVNVPAGLLGAVAGWFLLPRSTHLAPRKPFDWAGLLTLLPATAALLLGLSEGTRLGWGRPPVVALLALAALGVAAFIRHEGHHRAPLVDLRLFSQRRFTTGIATALLSYVVLFGLLTVAPFYLEDVRHASPAAAGTALLALSLGLAVVAPLAGRLADSAGGRALTTGALAVVAVALGALALRPGPTPLLLAALAAAGAGLGAFNAPNNTATTASVPPEQAGSASGLLNMTRGLGTAFGLAVAGAVFTAASGPGGGDPSRGFAAAVTVLAGVAAIAALLSARPAGPAVQNQARS